MQVLLDSIIYLLAVMGIIFTTISFFGMFTQKRIINNSYRIFTKNNENNKNIEVIICIENLDINEEKELVEKISNEKSINLKEIANLITIQKN